MKKEFQHVAIAYADPVRKKLKRLQSLEAFIRKLHDRLHPSILEDNVMTRLDSDLEEELETLLKRKK